MIYGDQIRLRAIEKEDLPDFVRWLNDPEVRQGLNLYLPLSAADEEDWFQQQRKLDPEERALAIEVQTEPDSEWHFIGNCGLLNLSWRDRSAEIGIHIGDKTFWNRGYGTKAVKLLLRHGFQTLNLHRLWLRVFDSNQRAIRVYHKAGFVPEGTFRQAHYQDGQYQDVQIMSVLHGEWKEQQKKERQDAS